MKKITLHKVHLATFIASLVDVYNSGAEFVDIVGTPDEIQDDIAIVVKPEYFSREQEEEQEDEEENKDLSDEDIITLYET